MRLLILSQYFPPEVGAPQNRLYELAVRLKAAGVDVEILTAMPNYPQMKIMAGYEGKKSMTERLGGLTVHRSNIYIPKSKSIIQRLANYFSFVYSSWKEGRKIKGTFHYVIVESPPLFLGISGYLLAKRLKAKIIFNVSDLWPESAEKLGLVTNKIFLRMATVLEEWLYKKAYLISGQTQGIITNISTRYPNKKYFWLKNGVDVKLYDEKLTTNWRAQNGFSNSDVLFLYAGIIGHAQGLEVILKAAKLVATNPAAKFLLVGSGPEKENLLQLKAELNLSNVFFFDVQPKEKMKEIVSAADVTIIPLRKLDLFKGAIPSKIFENLALGVPVLLGVDGEARDLFIKEGKAGLYFEPENEIELSEKINQLLTNPTLIKELGENGKAYVRSQFDRDVISNDFLNFLQENLPTKHSH